MQVVSKNIPFKMKSQEKKKKKGKIDFTGWEIKLTVLNSTVSTKPGHEAYMYCGVCNNGFAAHL